MSPGSQCPNCGGIIKHDTPWGGCPRCLLKLGFRQPETEPRPFGAYELRRQIGRGGMGVVYEAFQTTLNR